MIVNEEEALRFIEQFIDMKLEVTGESGSADKSTRKIFEELRNDKYDENQAFIKSMHIISVMSKRYSSYICIHTTRYIVEKNLLEKIQNSKEEQFLKKLASYIFNTYEFDLKRGNGCYDDWGMIGGAAYHIQCVIKEKYTSE